MEVILFLIVAGWIVSLFESKETKAKRANFQKKLDENPDMVDTLIG
jgi:hypothetical protein